MADQNDLNYNNIKDVVNEEQPIVVGKFRGKQISLKTFKNVDTKTKNLLQQLSELHHPNIQRAFKYEVNVDVHYLTLEICQSNLSDFIKSNKKILKKTQIILLLNGATKGLQFLHENEILHKNLHPKNIMVDVKGKFVKICNIGFETDKQEKVRNIFININNAVCRP